MIRKNTLVLYEPTRFSLYAGSGSEGKSDYESGFQPAYSGYVVNEMSDMSRFLPFGDTNEALLSTALGAIDGSIQPPAQEDTRSLRVPLSQIH